METKPILDILQDKETYKTPIWLMRQAGRYLPEYRELRSKTKSFMDAVLTPEVAAEITLQPIRRFGFDGAIIFSDILVIPYALGINVEFYEGVGPVLDYKFDYENPINSFLKEEKFYQVIGKIAETVSIVRKNLTNSSTATIGFAGAPWTVACYMLEKNRKKGGDFDETRKIAYQYPIAFRQLLQVLTDATIEFLIAQINAGAEVIKVFDSHAGLLGEKEFMQFVVKPMAKIITEIRKIHPKIPIIGFPRRSGLLYEIFVDETKVDCIAIDNTLSLDFVQKSLQTRCVVQGNLDNILLTLDLELSQKVINDSLEALLMKLNKGSPKRFIFNLGHGCLPSTKIENIEFVIKKLEKFQFR